jgi:hypothetical protein
MAGGDHSQEAVGSPAPVERGFATLNSLKYGLTGTLLWRLSVDQNASRIGVKAFVEKVRSVHTEHVHVTGSILARTYGLTEENLEWRTAEGRNTLRKTEK